MEEEAVFEDVNTELIQLVHKHNNLYDKSAKDYKDNLKRRESWAEIVAQFNNNTGCDVTGILHLYFNYYSFQIVGTFFTDK